MIVLKHYIDIEDSAIKDNLHRLTNQIYKLLPNREEGSDWEKPLNTIIVEIAGMTNLMIDQHTVLFPLLCKLEGLLTLTEENDFNLFRRTIFECLSLIGTLKNNVA